MYSCSPMIPAPVLAAVQLPATAVDAAAAKPEPEPEQAAVPFPGVDSECPGGP